MSKTTRKKAGNRKAPQRRDTDAERQARFTGAKPTTPESEAQARLVASVKQQAERDAKGLAASTMAQPLAADIVSQAVGLGGPVDIHPMGRPSRVTGEGGVDGAEIAQNAPDIVVDAGVQVGGRRRKLEAGAPPPRSLSQDEMMARNRTDAAATDPAMNFVRV